MFHAELLERHLLPEESEKVLRDRTGSDEASEGAFVFLLLYLVAAGGFVAWGCVKTLAQ